MNSRERVLNAIRRLPVDRVPCAPFFNFQDWTQRVGRQWQYPFGPSMEETLDYAVKVLDIDYVVQYQWKYYSDEKVSSEVAVEGDILRKKYFTPDGAISSAIRLNDVWPHGFDIPIISDYNIGHYVKPWLKSESDVDCLRYLMQTPKGKALDVERAEFSRLKKLAERYGVAFCFYGGLGLTGATLCFGAEQVATLAVDNPELIDRYLQIEHDYTMECYGIALDMGVDFIRRNGFYESCDLFSPIILEKFLSRRLKEEINLVHNTGKPIGYTILTGYAPVLDYLNNLGFDCLVCPDVFLKDGDAKGLKKKLGDCTSFWTGPSDTIHMPWENPEEVRKAVRYVFDVFGKTGLLITPCSSSKAVFPWSNVLAMVDEWKKLR